MAASKVTINTEEGEKVVLDLTGDSVTPETLAEGVTAHNAAGEQIVGTMGGENIPDYWNGAFTDRYGNTYTKYLDEKIARIKALQDEGGKDCFSFIVMTDMHYPSNLAHRAPTIAKKILDECDIRYALCLGDVQTRGCWVTKEQLLEENVNIEKMLSPIRDRLLQTEGNHDGAYYWSGGTYGSGTPYVKNLTPAELHSMIYRKVGLVGDVHFDESGSGYYIDDTANKVRYIILNTQCNKYELNEDGTSKYPKMRLFRLTQPQFDLVIDALNNIPSNSWGVVVGGHCPLHTEIGDGTLMGGVLKAFKQKKSYSGNYAGTAEGGAAYKNLAVPDEENTLDKNPNGWLKGYRISSTGASPESSGTPSTIVNYIPCTNGDVIRIKNATLRENSDRIQIRITRVDTGESADSTLGYYNVPVEVGTENGKLKVWTVEDISDGVYTIKLNEDYSHTITHLRFAMLTPTNANDVIITVNEEIKAGTAYDSVSVDCDFSNAKGELVGYFAGHVHLDGNDTSLGINVISTRCDAHEENVNANNGTTEDEELYNERKEGTITEQSFDVFTVNKATRTIHATKIGAGQDREISY